MPYNFTHALVGLTALQQSSEAVADLARRYRAEFLIGTMGPDPYFGDGMPKPLFQKNGLILAEKLHVLDGLTPGMRTLNIAKDPACRTCGSAG